MIHTFTIDTSPTTSRHRAWCDTCGKPMHKSPGVQSRDLAANDARQHAARAHDATDVAGNYTAWERIEQDDDQWMPVADAREVIENTDDHTAEQVALANTVLAAAGWE